MTEGLQIALEAANGEAIMTSKRGRKRVVSAPKLKKKGHNQLLSKQKLTKRGNLSKIWSAKEYFKHSMHFH